MSIEKTYTVDGEDSDVATRAQAVETVIRDIRDTTLSPRLKCIEVVSESDEYEPGVGFPVRDFQISVTLDEV